MSSLAAYRQREEETRRAQQGTFGPDLSLVMGTTGSSREGDTAMPSQPKARRRMEWNDTMDYGGTVGGRIQWLSTAETTNAWRRKEFPQRAMFACFMDIVAFIVMLGGAVLTIGISFQVDAIKQTDYWISYTTLFGLVVGSTSFIVLFAIYNLFLESKWYAVDATPSTREWPPSFVSRTINVLLALFFLASMGLVIWFHQINGGVVSDIRYLHQFQLTLLPIAMASATVLFAYIDFIGFDYGFNRDAAHASVAAKQ
jgi:hypothetical protein